MEAVLYLKVVLELAILPYTSTSVSTQKEVDCSRFCILNETCFRYWTSVTRDRLHWLGNTDGLQTRTEKEKTCLGHPGYKYEGPGLCIKYVTTHMLWNKARDTCVTDGASLVKIDSEEKNTFLKTSYASTSIKRIWLGGNDQSQEGRWEWSDGTQISGFVDWRSHEPDGFILQNCMTMDGHGWGSGRCYAYPDPFLCEILLD